MLEKTLGSGKNFLTLPKEPHVSRGWGAGGSRKAGVQGAKMKQGAKSCEKDKLPRQGKRRWSERYKRGRIAV